MNIPRWKRWLSHLKPLTLEQTASVQNPELTVMLDRGRLQLLSGEAIYSWDDLYKNFRQAFEELDIRARPTADVLVLGLGLGSVPFMLETLFGRQYYYTAVEWDETVAELAHRYTLSRLRSPIDVVTGDAEVFVEVTEEHFDLVVVDIFEDEITPPQFCTPEFLERCRAMLRPRGLLLFNRLHGEDPAVRSVTERFFERTFRQVFPEGRYIDTQGNWILVGEKG